MLLRVFSRNVLMMLMLAIAVASGGTSFAQTGGATLAELITKLPDGNYADREEVMLEIAATGDPAAESVLVALEAGELVEVKADGRVVRGEKMVATIFCLMC